VAGNRSLHLFQAARGVLVQQAAQSGPMTSSGSQRQPRNQ